jgi:hypothetical protein
MEFLGFPLHYNGRAGGESNSAHFSVEENKMIQYITAG